MSNSKRIYGWKSGRPNKIENCSYIVDNLSKAVIKDEKPPEVVIHHEEKVNLIPSDIGLSDMEVSHVNVMAHEKNHGTGIGAV